tara:strand:- start:8443 stop:8997 length:555 start_codon:yes stop_codon:yes gene_type:complete
MYLKDLEMAKDIMDIDYIDIQDHLYIGIDPGVSGGICCITGPDMVAIKCPGTTSDMSEVVSVVSDISKHSGYKCYAIIESVHSMPGQGVKSCFTFGKNYGEWLGILAANKVPYKQVTPQKWMKLFGVMPKDKKARKNHIKHLAQQRYPDSKITLATSDAILIAEYCRNDSLASIGQSLMYKDIN